MPPRAQNHPLGPALADQPGKAWSLPPAQQGQPADAGLRQRHCKTCVRQCGLSQANAHSRTANHRVKPFSAGRWTPPEKSREKSFKTPDQTGRAISRHAPLIAISKPQISDFRPGREKKRSPRPVITSAFRSPVSALRWTYQLPPGPCRGVGIPGCWLGAIIDSVNQRRMPDLLARPVCQYVATKPRY